MKTRNCRNWSIAATVALAACGTLGVGSGCTEEEAAAILAGVQVIADELDDNNDDVSFRDWLSSELDD